MDIADEAEDKAENGQASHWVGSATAADYKSGMVGP